jgi:hypothetical protein
VTIEYEETLKPAVVETALDRFFFRPVAHVIVRAVHPTPLGAHGVTAIGVVVGLSGASLLRYSNARELIPGALLLLVYAILDCADGQLARANGTESRLGRILDGLGYVVVGMATTAGLAMHLAADGGEAGAWLAVLGLGSVALQGFVFDFFKTRYLTRSGSDYKEGDDLDETLADLERGGSAVAILDHVYALYLRVQRVLGRGMPDAPPEDAAKYGRDLAPLARGWAFLDGSTHLALMATFICVGLPSAYVWLRLTIGNVAMVLLFVEQRRRERAQALPVARAPNVAPAASAPTHPPATAEPRREEVAPISWRPPRMDE